MQYCHCWPCPALLAQLRTLLLVVLAVPLFDVLQTVPQRCPGVLWASFGCFQAWLHVILPLLLIRYILIRCIHSRECLGSEHLHISAHHSLLLFCVARKTASETTSTCYMQLTSPVLSLYTGLPVCWPVSKRCRGGGAGEREAGARRGGEPGGVLRGGHPARAHARLCAAAGRCRAAAWPAGWQRRPGDHPCLVFV